MAGPNYQSPQTLHVNLLWTVLKRNYCKNTNPTATAIPAPLQQATYFKGIISIFRADKKVEAVFMFCVINHIHELVYL